MIRTFAAVLTLVISLAVAHAAPVPKGAEKRPNYFPTAVGTKWEYRSSDVNTTITITVIDGSTKDGTNYATTETRTNDRPIATERIAVSEKGVFRDQLNKAAIDPPIELLRFPAKADDTWEVRSTLGAQIVSGTYTTRAAEAVEVSAGKYKAVRVEAQCDIAGTKTDVTTWYAPDVGMVKLMYRIAGNEVTLELKTFTPGKK